MDCDEKRVVIGSCMTLKNVGDIVEIEIEVVIGDDGGCKVVHVATKDST